VEKKFNFNIFTCVAIADGALLEEGVDLEQLLIVGRSLEVLNGLGGLVETLQPNTRSGR
jgi:hypothetical protein